MSGRERSSPRGAGEGVVTSPGTSRPRPRRGSVRTVPPGALGSSEADHPDLERSSTASLNDPRERSVTRRVTIPGGRCTDRSHRTPGPETVVHRTGLGRGYPGPVLRSGRSSGIDHEFGSGRHLRWYSSPTTTLRCLRPLPCPRGHPTTPRCTSREIPGGRIAGTRSRGVSDTPGVSRHESFKRETTGNGVFVRRLYST